jgi:hypothetical protein
MRIIFQISEALLTTLIRIVCSLPQSVETNRYPNIQLVSNTLPAVVIKFISFDDIIATQTILLVICFLHHNSHSVTVVYSFIQHAWQGQWAH